MNKVYQFQLLAGVIIFVFLLYPLGTTYAQTIQDGLVAYYPLDGNANDESGNGNNGTVYGATPSTGRFGETSGSYAFDGVSDYIGNTTETIDLGKLDDGVTIAAYIKLNEVDISKDYGVFDICNGWAMIGVKNGKLWGRLFISLDTGYQVDGNTLLAANQWYHIALTYDDNVMKIYLNSVEDGTNTINKNFPGRSQLKHFRIGALSVTPELFLPGKIDDLYLFGRALTFEEIQELHDISPNNPPVAVAQNLTISTTECTINVTPEQVDNGSSDPDGDNLSYTLEPAGPYSVGDNPVSLIVSDGTLSDIASSIITVTGGCPDGLVAHYPFDGNANDESGNSNDGIVLGATLTTDRFGNSSSAYDFDGIDDFILINDSPTLDLNEGMTLTAWIQADVIPVNGAIVSKRFDSSWDTPYVVYDLQIISQSLNQAHATIGVDGTLYDIGSGSNTINIGNWKFITCTYDGETMLIYVDGQFKRQNTNPSGNIDINNEVVTIGAQNNGVTNFFNGVIDDIRIYNRALSAEEILELYTPNTTPNNPPVAIAQNLTIEAIECTIEVTPQQVDNGSTDPDGDILSYVLEPAGPYSVGDNPVSLIVSDGTLSDIASSIITVTGGCPGGLLAYYSFDGNSNDESGLGNNGTVIGATLSGDLCNIASSSYYFDGVDDYIDLGNSNILKPQLPVTVAAWVKFNGVGNPIFTNNYSDNRYSGIWMYQWGGPIGPIIIAYGDGDGISDQSRRSKTGLTPLEEAEWTHVVGIIRGPTDMDIYINGVNDGGSYSGTGGDLTYDSGSSNIGRKDFANTGPPNFATGNIDEVYFYNRVLSEEEIFDLYNITCPNGSPTAIAQNLTIAITTDCTIEVTPQQVDNGSSDPDGDNLSYVLEPSGPYSLGNNPVSLIVSDGVFSDTASSIITVTGGSGSVTGTVKTITTGLEGITVKLLENETPTNIVDESFTDALGQYSFTDMALNDYQVMIIVPLGYAVDQNFVTTTLTCGETDVVDFNLTEIIVHNNARGKGYWKHQFDVYVKEKGNAHETEQDLTTFISEVHNRYDPRFNIFVDESTFEDWQNVLSVKGNAGMEEKAKSHIAALALNIMSQKIAQYEIVTEDDYTAADVLTYVSELLLDSDPDNDELAKDLAEQVNEQQTIAAGLVHPSQNILYKHQGLVSDPDKSGVPSQFSLHQNYPNPFNPSTAITFDLPKDAFVSLKIYDVSGRMITQLVKSFLNAGHYRTEFNGSDLASGIYYYELTANEFRSVKKLVLAK